MNLQVVSPRHGSKAAALALGWAAAVVAAQNASAAQPSVTPEQLHEWGKEALAVSDRDLWLADRGLYAERTPRRRRRSLQPAFMWSASVQLTALAAASRLEPDSYSARLTQNAEALQSYWKLHEGIAGYDVLPAPSPPDRYYDDNAWIVLALVEISEITGDEKYLDRAELSFEFVLSGEDGLLGGGVYWREREKESKNTCSNAPTVTAALRLHQRRPNDKWLAAAERLHAWTCEQLQADDGLFWDNLKIDGELDRRQYSYNTALMIRASCLFHQLTGEPRWLTQAQRMARAAEAKWVDADTGAIHDGGPFAHMLLEALWAVYELDHDARWRNAVERALVFLHDEVRDPEGRYPHSWDRPTEAPLRGFTLIDQASAARAFFVAAERLERDSSGQSAD